MSVSADAPQATCLLTAGNPGANRTSLQTRNKPFCDNSHDLASFKDYGAIGDTGPDFDSQGGELKINPVKDGPLLVSGKMTLVTGSGRKSWRGEQTALCRCGQSGNKPFCDGAHVKAGFTSG